MTHKTSVSISFLRVYRKNGIFSVFYFNKYGKLPVYGAVFVFFSRLGGLYNSQATNRNVPEGSWVPAQSTSCLLVVVWKSYMTPSRMVTPVYKAAKISVERWHLHTSSLPFYIYMWILSGLLSEFTSCHKSLKKTTIFPFVVNPSCRQPTLFDITLTFSPQYCSLVFFY